MGTHESEPRRLQPPSEWNIGGRIFTLHDPELVFGDISGANRELISLTYPSDSVISKLQIKSRHSRDDYIGQFSVSCILDFETSIYDVASLEKAVANPSWKPSFAPSFDFVRRVPCHSPGKYVIEVGRSRQILLDFTKVQDTVRLRITNNRATIEQNVEPEQRVPIEAWDTDPKAELHDCLSVFSSILNMVQDGNERYEKFKSIYGAEHISHWYLNSKDNDALSNSPIDSSKAHEVFAQAIHPDTFIGWLKTVLPKHYPGRKLDERKAVDGVIHRRDIGDDFRFPDDEGRREILSATLAAMSIDYWSGNGEFRPDLSYPIALVDRLVRETYGLLRREIILSITEAKPSSSSDSAHLYLTDLLVSIDHIRNSSR